jgi:hypothetical protein
MYTTYLSYVYDTLKILMYTTHVTHDVDHPHKNRINSMLHFSIEFFLMRKVYKMKA